jgi:sodium transport system ATP-binding protein
MTIKVRNLTKEFYDEARNGDMTAVDGVSFECDGGKIFGLLGPNGAGKTTTLRMLTTILKPSGGEALICGHDVVKEPTVVRRKIGFLSADTGVYERLTPREILTYFARINHYPEDKLIARTNSVLEMLSMNDFADTRCEKLSTGMRQKTSIARSVIHDPEVLIFDEPTNGLDVLTIRAMQDFIWKCREQGKCILLSTHIMSEAEKLCDRIGIIHKGKLLSVGNLEELRAQTSKHYLEDVFVEIVRERVGEII